MVTATAETVERGPIVPIEGEQTALGEIVRILSAGAAESPLLVEPDGQRIELPESVIRVLRQAVRAMAQDRAVAVVPIHKQLTTQEAADLLLVSRPYLVKLLDEGEIPSTKTGTHRRVRLEDLLAYAKVRDARRREALDLLTQESQDMGLYSTS